MRWVLMCCSACGGRLTASSVLDSDAPEAGVRLSVDAGAGADADGTPPLDAATDQSHREAAADATLDSQGGPDGFDAQFDDSATDAGAADSGDLPDGLPTVVCDAGEPVAQCVEYFALLSTCTGEDFLDGACQPGLIPTGAESLQQIELFCEGNPDASPRFIGPQRPRGRWRAPARCRRTKSSRCSANRRAYWEWRGTSSALAGRGNGCAA